MSQTVIFIIGAVIFAIVVYGAVMAGGMALGAHMDATEVLDADAVRRP